MFILKRKEVIAAALVALIGVAGYLNWSYQDTIRVSDNGEYIETGKSLNEPQFLKSTSEKTQPKTKENKEEKSEENKEVKNDQASAFEASKTDRKNSRSKTIEILTQTAENKNFDDEIRKEAQQKIIDIAGVSEKETIIENIARAKGYSDICVYANEDTANITVKKKDFSQDDAKIIQEIACEQLNFLPKNIKIVAVE